MTFRERFALYNIKIRFITYLITPFSKKSPRAIDILPTRSLFFDAGNCSENDCVMLVNFEHRFNLWISLCTTWYKEGFCCGMQQTVIFIEISGCGRLRTPYNAHPSRRHTTNQVVK
ncbi:hypothetical protein CRM81_18890 [Yersinia kristensenii]|nr:hypothetical protein CRM81_18890 [Yersinia kristensenii]